MREPPSVSPVVPMAEVPAHNNKRITAASSPQQLDGDLHLDPDNGTCVGKNEQEEDPLDMEEVSKSLHPILEDSPLTNNTLSLLFRNTEAFKHNK